MSGARSEIEKQQVERSPDAAIDIDLYCLHCGYNLRGLSGDPVRCPECAFLNPIGDVEIPAPVISQQLRRMETAPAFSVLGLLIMLPALSGVVAMALDRQVPGEVLACPLCAVGAAAAVWLAGVAYFRSSCLGRPGWLAALMRYQLVGLVLAGLVLGPFWLATSALMKHGWRVNAYFGEAWPCIAPPVLFVVVVVGVVWGLRRVHRWLRAPMEQLQRQVAIKIARDRVRRKLRQRRRWGRGI